MKRQITTTAIAVLVYVLLMAWVLWYTDITHWAARLFLMMGAVGTAILSWDLSEEGRK